MRERVKILSPCNFVRGRRGVPGRLLVRRGRKRQDSLCRRHVCCYGRLSIGCRVLWQMLAPPQSLQTLLRRLCWQMLRSPCTSPSAGYAGRCSCPRSPCSCSSGGYAGRCSRQGVHTYATCSAFAAAASARFTAVPVILATAVLKRPPTSRLSDP